MCTFAVGQYITLVDVDCGSITRRKVTFAGKRVVRVEDRRERYSPATGVQLDLSNRWKPKQENFSFIAPNVRRSAMTKAGYWVPEEDN